ncbi:MAG TPA: phage tail protein [Allosphingosinicella sp.]|nr:phage tail protein [Allosphingosinicella sp.]
MAETPESLPTLPMPLLLARTGVYPDSFEGPRTAAMFTLGMLHAFAGGFAVFNTLMPDGAQLPVAGNQQLASLTWQTFGGDAPTAMNLPDVRGKVITGGGPSADAGGAAAVQLNLLIAATGQPSGAPLAGMIVPFIGAAIPDGWLACDGSMVAAAEFPALAGAIGTRFGRAGGRFALPDLRGAAPVGAGAIVAGQRVAGAVPGLALDFLLSAGGIYPQPADNLAPAIPATQPFLGQVVAWAGASVPAGWLKADGALLPTPESEEYMELFNLIGTTFGGDQDNFALPDLRGRMIAGAAPAG